MTVVEWGLGLAEDLAPARLELEITRPRGGSDRGGDDGDEARSRGREVREGARWSGGPLGERWAGFALVGADGLADPARRPRVTCRACCCSPSTPRPPR